MSARSLALLFAALVVFHCLGNWSLPLIDRDEPRFAEASREMLERGDFVVPYFNNQYRFDKPPLIYWMQCGTFAALGESEFAARLPSAICAALTAVALALWAARLWDVATGWRAAIVFSLCLQTLIHARSSVADMPMVLCVTLAAWAGWEWRTRGSQACAAAFWVALAVGFLAKGPIAWLPLGMVWWSGLPRPASRRRDGLVWVGGALGMLAIIALWGVPALIRTQGEFAAIGLGKHVVARSVAPLEGHGGTSLLSYLALLPMYFVTVWLSFLPWCLWLPAAARSYWQRGFGRGSIERYLFAGVVLCFGIFTLSRTKLPHYTLPCFPFMALLLAVWWRDAARPERVFRRTVIIAGSCAVLLFLVGFPLGRRLFPAESLYAQSEPLLRPEMELATVEHHEPSLVWIFRRRIDGYQTSLKPRKLAEWLTKPGPRLVVIPETTLRELALTLDPALQLFRASGWNLVKGRQVTLVLIVKPG